MCMVFILVQRLSCIILCNLIEFFKIFCGVKLCSSLVSLITSSIDKIFGTGNVWDFNMCLNLFKFLALFHFYVAFSPIDILFHQSCPYFCVNQPKPMLCARGPFLSLHCHEPRMEISTSAKVTLQIS